MDWTDVEDEREGVARLWETEEKKEAREALKVKDGKETMAARGTQEETKAGTVTEPAA